MCSCENVEFNRSLSKIIFLGCCNCSREPVCAGRCRVLTQEEFFFLLLIPSWGKKYIEGGEGNLWDEEADGPKI